MGSRLALLAAVQLSAAAFFCSDALAESRARELYKRGIEEYKAQKYEDAVATLKESYELEPKSDALFALAQAERLGGRCPEARVHYKKLLDSTTDAGTIKVVQSNLELCGPEPEKPAPAAAPEKPVAAPSPPPRTRTVVREVRHTDKLATLLLASGMLGVGASGGLYLAAKNSREDADHALTLDDHVRLSDRANTLRVASYAAAGAGVLMVGVAVVRWAVGGEDKKTETTEVTLAPSASGAMLVLSSGW